MRSQAPRIANEILRGVVGVHPYGTTIEGDLAEEFSWLEYAMGVGAARRWYRREVARTIVAIVPTLRFTAGAALRAFAVVIVAYTSAIQLSNGASSVLRDWLADVIGQWRVVALLGMMMTFGALAGAVSTRAVTGARALGAVLLIALALLVGAAHVGSSPAAELWFRAAKVGCFVVAIAGGASIALPFRPPDRRKT